VGGVWQVNELGSVPSGGNDDADRVGHAFAGFVDILETFAEGVEGDADDGVGLGIEIFASAEGFDRDGVLLDLVATTCGGFFADVAKDLRQVRRAAESSGLQQPFELRALRKIQTGRCQRRSHRGDSR